MKAVSGPAAYVQWREAPQRWEYTRVPVDRDGRPVEGEVDPATLGRLGWELVGVLSVGKEETLHAAYPSMRDTWETLPYGVLFFKRSLDMTLLEEPTP